MYSTPDFLYYCMIQYTTKKIDAASFLVLKEYLWVKKWMGCFFPSATWPKGVQRMADQYMKNPVRVFVGSLDLNVSTSTILVYVLYVVVLNVNVLLFLFIPHFWFMWNKVRLWNWCSLFFSWLTLSIVSCCDVFKLCPP